MFEGFTSENKKDILLLIKLYENVILLNLYTMDVKQPEAQNQTTKGSTKILWIALQSVEVVVKS